MAAKCQLDRESVFAAASSIANVMRQKQAVEPGKKLLTFTGVNPNHAGPCLSDLEANFGVLWEVLNVWQTRPPPLQEMAMVLHVANQKCDGSIFEAENTHLGGGDLDTDLLALKLANRIKTLCQYARGLKQKSKSSKRWKVHILKALIKISQYAWSLRRILYATRLDVFD